MKLRLHAEAEAEFDQAYAWYRDEDLDLAEDFSRCVERGIRTILESPDRWSEVSPGVRRYLVNRFPYALVYEVRADELFVVAIAHLRRRASYWRPRL